MSVRIYCAHPGGRDIKTIGRYSWSDKTSAAHEAHRLLSLVEVGAFSVDQARSLILITDREAATLRKLLDPLTASTVFDFRKNTLRIFDALTVQPAKTRGRR